MSEMSDVQRQEFLKKIGCITVGAKATDGISNLILDAIKASKDGLTAMDVCIAIHDKAGLEPKELGEAVMKWLKSSTADNKLEKKYGIKFEWIHDEKGERTFKFKG